MNPIYIALAVSAGISLLGSYNQSRQLRRAARADKRRREVQAIQQRIQANALRKHQANFDTKLEYARSKCVAVEAAGAAIPTVGQRHCRRRGRHDPHLEGPQWTIVGPLGPRRKGGISFGVFGTAVDSVTMPCSTLHRA